MTRRLLFIGLLCLGLLGARAQAQTVYYITTTNGNDNANGLTPATAWATFKNLNFVSSGSHTFPGANTFMLGGVWNGAGGLSYTINNPVCYGTSNAPQIFTNWGSQPWGITNYVTGAAIRLAGYNWLSFQNGYFSDNGYAFYLTQDTNIEVNNCLINGSGIVGVQFTVYDACQSNWFHNITSTNAGGYDNSGNPCSDGGSDTAYLGTFVGSTDPTGYNITENCVFGYEGHAGFEDAGAFEYDQNITLLNPPFYQATWCGATTVGNTSLTGPTWWGGREGSLGGGNSSNSVFQDFRVDYGGFVPDMPGALDLEQCHAWIVRDGEVSCSSGVGLMVYGTDGGNSGSNICYNISIGLCASNRTFYTTGQEVSISYPEYQHPIGCYNTSNNVFVNILAFQNFTDTGYFAEGFSFDVADWRSVSTNTNPNWVSLANSIDVLNPTPPILPDFHLTAGSPAIAGGTWLAYIATTSGSGTSFTLYSNANYFSTGATACTRYIPGDTLQFQGSSQTATVVSISGQTLTVTPSVVWTQGQGLMAVPPGNSLYQGAAPDLGGYAYQAPATTVYTAVGGLGGQVWTGSVTPSTVIVGHN